MFTSKGAYEEPPPLAQPLPCPLLQQAISHISDVLRTPSEADASSDQASSVVSSTQSSTAPSRYSSSADSLLCDHDSISYWMRRDYSAPGRRWRPAYRPHSSTKTPPVRYFDALLASTHSYNRSRERLLYARMNSLSSYTRLLRKFTADCSLWTCKYVDPPRYLHSTTFRPLTSPVGYTRSHHLHNTLPRASPAPTMSYTTATIHNTYCNSNLIYNHYYNTHNTQIKTIRIRPHRTQVGVTSLEFTLTPPSHRRHYTTHRVRNSPAPPPTEFKTPPPLSHSLTFFTLKRFFLCSLLSAILLLLILTTTTVYCYATWFPTLLQLPCTPLSLHNVAISSYYQHALPPLPAFPYTETGSLLTFHSMPQRILQVPYYHTPITALPLTLEHHDSSSVEHSVRHTRITPLSKGCSNHMGCLSALPLLLLFEYHNYYPP